MSVLTNHRTCPCWAPWAFPSNLRLQGNVHMTLKVSWWGLLCGLCRESMLVADGQLLKVFSRAFRVSGLVSN